jgi:predicted dehydrogenase
MDHGEKAIGFLERGIPTYIDKPLAPTLEKAERLISLARQKGALLMSCSALRYARELEAFQKERDEVGDITVGVGVAAVGEVLRYGIHPLELVHTIMGRGVEYVQNVGDEGSNIVKVAYPDGRRIVLLAFKNMSYTLEGIFYGKKGHRAVTVKDDGYFYSNMLKHFVEGIKNKKMPVPLDDTLEIVKICLAAERSLKTGEKVYLN